MPRINTTRSGHHAPASIAGITWLPFTAGRHLDTLRRAMHLIDTRIKGARACDAAFRALPGGRSFAQVWTDQTIWLSYDPTANGSLYGATNQVGGRDVTICEFTFRMGEWTTAGTLIHELAHANGADGISHDAEGTLHSCLLSKVEDPTIIGMLRPLTPRVLA